MIRWLRIAAVGTVVLAFIALGVGTGLFLVANNSFQPVRVHRWLHWLVGDTEWEAWMPVLLSGWLVAVLGLAVLFVWSMYYVWRRRQYESLIARLERELVALRNLPFTDPAPLEDLPETPDPAAARTLAAAARYTEGDGDARPAER